MYRYSYLQKRKKDDIVQICHVKVFLTKM